jgi:O-antigen/teichoic acid export membrane protein
LKTKTAGKFSGDLFLLISQLVFLVCGYGIQVIITRFLSPEDYGSWGVLTSVLVWFELTIISGFPKGVTKFIAESDVENQAEIHFRSYFVQLFVGIGLGGIFYLLANPLSGFWNSPDLGLLFQISALDIPIYGLYFENMAVLNGKHRYRSMFVLQGVYSVSKLGLIVLLVVGGYGLTGAAWGNVLASVIAFLLSQILVGLPPIPRQKRFAIRRLIAFCIPSTIFVILFALVQRLDFLFLKTLTRFPKVLGYYWAAQLLAQVPYYLIEGTSKKMFSELSEYHGQGDWENAGRSFRESLHLTFLLVGLIVSVTLGSAQDLILLLFPREYGEASLILMILILANSFIAFMYLFSQVLFSFSREKTAMLVASVMVIVAGILCWLLISWKGAVGAAGAALVSFLLGTIVLFLIIKPYFTIHFSFPTIAKIGSAFLFTIGLGILLQVEGLIGILLKLVFITSFHLIYLYLAKEPIVKTIGDRLLQRLRFKS